ncbi:MAG: hypothetical protein LBI53_00250 [Candidatus Peribacteria bacterium]|jgi:F0F1-type ATP synthase membrane subunit b/b'|nr:hypothetical protein [Candidatus Peribacteria bacterium]
MHFAVHHHTAPELIYQRPDGNKDFAGLTTFSFYLYPCLMEIKRGILIAQIINFAILFFLVKIFLGDKLIKIINERRVLIRKLKQADEEYEKMIELAKRESNKIIMTANRKKELIEEEGKILAGKERQNILTLATTKGEMIVQDAKKK